MTKLSGGQVQMFRHPAPFLQLIKPIEAYRGTNLSARGRIGKILTRLIFHVG